MFNLVSLCRRWWLKSPSCSTPPCAKTCSMVSPSAALTLTQRTLRPAQQGSEGLQHLQPSEVNGAFQLFMVHEFIAMSTPFWASATGDPAGFRGADDCGCKGCLCTCALAETSLVIEWLWLLRLVETISDCTRQVHRVHWTNQRRRIHMQRTEYICSAPSTHAAHRVHWMHRVYMQRTECTECTEHTQYARSMPMSICLPNHA